eukprot:NODE_140_length_16098_cov_0.678605.p16 type:complete len:133 gc:universal NODE_140_length_16098_cov_0.678605:13184-12786(-)
MSTALNSKKVTLEACLYDKTVPPYDKMSFVDFCKANYVDENLYFMDQINELRISPTFELAKAIYLRYISPRAKKQINLPANIVKEAETLVNREARADLILRVYEKAYSHVVDMLNTDVFPRFVKKAETGDQV